jgi:hypothetical protein
MRRAASSAVLGGSFVDCVENVDAFSGVSLLGVSGFVGLEVFGFCVVEDGSIRGPSSSNS